MTNNWIWAGGFLALAVGGIGFGAKAGVESGRAALRLEAAVVKTHDAEAQAVPTAAALDHRGTAPTSALEAESTRMADATAKLAPEPKAKPTAETAAPEPKAEPVAETAAPEPKAEPVAETAAPEPKAEPVAKAAPAPAQAEAAPAPKPTSNGDFESWPDETEGDAYPYAARIDVDTLGQSPARI